MKTRLLIIGIIGVSVFGLIDTDSVFALPFISPEHSYENAKYVVVGRVLSVEILSEPYVQNSTGIYSQRFGFALYEIQVDEFLKNPINNSTMKILGKYTNQKTTMTYVTFPYEVNQRVLLYIHELNHIPGYDLIITAANSRVIPEEPLSFDEYSHFPLDTDLPVEPIDDLSKGIVDCVGGYFFNGESCVPEPDCGPNTLLTNGLCVVIDGGCEPDINGNTTWCGPQYDYLKIILSEPYAFLFVFGTPSLIAGIIIGVVAIWRKRK